MTEGASIKVANFIKGNLLNFIVALTSFGYILYNEVVLHATVSLADATASVFIGIICGLIIKMAMGENGIVKGYSSKIWQEANTTYKAVCNTANEFIDRVDNFYEVEKKETLKKLRRVNMVSGQMRYAWFFTEDGEYIENTEKYEKLKKRQKRILRYCVKVRTHVLNLFSEYNLELKDTTRREKTDKDQRSASLTKNIAFTLVTAFVGGVLTASFDKWNWANFIFAIIQVIVWIAVGTIQLYTNYNYVVIEKVNKLARKKELIIKFKKGCEQGLYKDEEEVKEVEEIGEQDGEQEIVYN